MITAFLKSISIWIVLSVAIFIVVTFIHPPVEEYCSPGSEGAARFGCAFIKQYSQQKFLVNLLISTVLGGTANLLVVSAKGRSLRSNLI